MIYYNGGVCYILLKEGKYTVKISHVVPTNPQIAEELLLKQKPMKRWSD